MFGLSRLPSHLRQLIFSQIRYATTTTAGAGAGEPSLTDVAFPFPGHPNPTPHEIFHLPRGASQSQVKARYYELVRIHHPDCPAARELPPDTSHIRFQAISDAYGVLSGKQPASASSPFSSSSSSSYQRYSYDAPYYEEIARRRRAHWRAPAGSDEFGYGPKVWDQKERESLEQSVLVMFIATAIASTIILVLVSAAPITSSGREKAHNVASKNLADARREAKEIAEIRRLALLRSRSADDDGAKMQEAESRHSGDKTP